MAKQNEAKRLYNSSAKGKATQRRWANTPKGKATIARARSAYDARKRAKDIARTTEWRARQSLFEGRTLTPKQLRYIPPDNLYPGRLQIKIENGVALIISDCHYWVGAP